MRNQKGHFLSHVPRQVIIRAHQEQLDEMAELDFKEETLMTQMDSNVSSAGQTCGLSTINRGLFDGHLFAMVCVS